MFILQWFFIQCICEVLTVKFGGQDQYRFEKLSNIIKQLESQKGMWETDVYSVKEGWCCVIHFLWTHWKGNMELEGLSSIWVVRTLKLLVLGGSNWHARDWGTHWFFYDEGALPPCDRINVGVLRPRNQENHGKTHEGAIHLESSCLSMSNEGISKDPRPSGLLVTKISKCCVHLL